MINLKDYTTTIRATIKEISKADENYNWKVNYIGKGLVRFQWGYLSDNDDQFEMKVDEYDGDNNQYVIVNVPYAESYICIIVGESRWDDAKTLEDGIRKALKAAANYAQHTF